MNAIHTAPHTPGPWFLDDAQPGDHFRYVMAGKGDAFGYICRISTNGNANPEADARLIAVAPDLLDAVKGFRRKLETYVSVYPGDKELRRLLSNCDAAIAKATGETA